MRHIFAVCLLSLSVASLPNGAESRTEGDDQLVMNVMEQSDKPLMRVMHMCGIPGTRGELEKFLRYSQSELAVHDGRELLLSLYPLMKHRMTGINRYLPAGIEFFSSNPLQIRRPSEPIGRHDCVKCTVKCNNFLPMWSNSKEVVGSYTVKYFGSDDFCQPLAIDMRMVGPFSKDGCYSFLCSDNNLKIASFIPDLRVWLMVVRKPTTSGSSHLEVWRGQDDRVKLPRIKFMDQNSYLKLSANRTHFYVIIKLYNKNYRVLIGSTEPFTELEDALYNSPVEPVIDGDLLEMEGKLVNLASFWEVGKLDYPLPEDFVLRATPGDTVTLVDTTKSRLVDSFRQYCKDFRSLLPRTREPRILLLEYICKLLTSGKLKDEENALQLIAKFTEGRRRSDGDIVRMFGELIEGRAHQAEEMKLKGKRKRPFDLVKTAPTVLPSAGIATEIIDRFDSEQARLLGDVEYAADVDFLGKLLESE